MKQTFVHERTTNNKKMTNNLMTATQ